MTYPKASPAAKHDLLCSNSIIDAIIHHQPSAAVRPGDNAIIESIDALASSIVQSAEPTKQPADLARLSTIYTYPDAPTTPKPLSRSMRVWRLVRRSLFDRAINNGAENDGSNSVGLLRRCTIAVKLPEHLPPNDARSEKNSKSFNTFTKYLHDHQLVAVLACDSAERVGFVVPISDNKEGHAAHLFHANAGAAASAAFYSGLTRSLDTRADSRLYHMRAFNGWVKATQIAELDPDTTFSRASNGKKRPRTSPLRVLDLACGKGGDLGKWTLHRRRIENYVGVDVARRSLVDAAIRARQMSTWNRNKSMLHRCTFVLADLGEDVPGRKRSKKAKRMQKLMTWNLQGETAEEKKSDPVFVPMEGGGIAESDKFDVVSIQFAIHYMMSTRKRARRFFNTVNSLLEVGGNLIATTIDARVVMEKLMGLGLDFHFDEFDQHVDVDKPENEERHQSGNKKRKVDNSEATVSVGRGACRLKFDSDTLRKVFQPPKTPEDMFGLQYTFTLVEGSDHAAGVGEAVDLPEWLVPIPALEELAEESGLRLEYATNFHKFYGERQNPSKFPMAQNALYNMKVLNRDGSISAQEWEVSRMYIAMKFRKVREPSIGDQDVGEDEMRD